MARNWQEIRRVNWDNPAPPAPNGSCPPSHDWGVTIWSRYTWPDTEESGIYAGRTYERREHWQGPDATYRQHVMFSSCEYPAPCEAGCGRPMAPRSDRCGWAECQAPVTEVAPNVVVVRPDYLGEFIAAIATQETGDAS
jgi:hypothetical protein